MMDKAQILAEAEARQDDTLTFAEWGAVPSEIRSRVARERGYRSRSAVAALAVAAAPAPATAPQKTAPPTPGATSSKASPSTAAAAGFTPAPPKPATPEEDWARDPALREEFGTLECFLAYERARAAGRTGTVAGATAPSERPAETTAPNVRGLTLEEDTVRAWHADPSLRREFASLDEYAALRRYVAGATEPDSPPAGVSRERLQTERAREEDRVAGVDPRLPAEERALEAWRSSAAIRWEFRGNRDAFVAFRRHLERRR